MEENSTDRVIKIFKNKNERKKEENKEITYLCIIYVVKLSIFDISW